MTPENTGRALRGQICELGGGVRASAAVGGPCFQPGTRATLLEGQGYSLCGPSCFRIHVHFPLVAGRRTG
jgi:hypothetical protein